VVICHSSRYLSRLPARDTAAREIFDASIVLARRPASIGQSTEPGAANHPARRRAPSTARVATAVWVGRGCAPGRRALAARPWTGEGVPVGVVGALDHELADWRLGGTRRG
jgi:hypothetical protein